jgi:hypothetical protein
MPWIKLTSLTGRAQYIKSTVWMQPGKAQVRKTPEDIVKQLTKIRTENEEYVVKESLDQVLGVLDRPSAVEPVRMVALPRRRRQNKRSQK